jgi:hypothetical protein
MRKSAQIHTGKSSCPEKLQKSRQLLKEITATSEGNHGNNWRKTTRFLLGLTTTGTTKDNIYLAHKLAATSRRKKLSHVVQVVFIKT